MHSSSNSSWAEGHEDTGYVPWGEQLKIHITNVGSQQFRDQRGIHNSNGKRDEDGDAQWESGRPCSTDQSTVGWEPFFPRGERDNHLTTHILRDDDQSTATQTQHSPQSRGVHQDVADVPLSSGENPRRGPAAVRMKDPELERKMMELRKLEEKIKRKRAALAQKDFGPAAKKMAEGAFMGEEHESRDVASQQSFLKERVNVILQQRRPTSSVSQERLTPSDTAHVHLKPHKPVQPSRTGGDLDHPLRDRVQALMEQRCTRVLAPDGDREVSDVPPSSPPSQSFAAEREDDSKDNKGFLRFLNVLNKGVDISRLTRIIKGHPGDVPAAVLPSSSRSPAPENRTDRLPSLADMEQQCRRPPRREETTKPGGEGTSQEAEREGQLRSILKAVGLDLGAEEMSKLTDRTHERLYGKKHRDKPASESRPGTEEDPKNQTHSESVSSSLSPRSSRQVRSSSGDTPERRTAPEPQRPPGGHQNHTSAQRDYTHSETDSGQMSSAYVPYVENGFQATAAPYGQWQPLGQWQPQYPPYPSYSGDVSNKATRAQWNVTPTTDSPARYPSACPDQNASHHPATAPPVYPPLPDKSRTSGGASVPESSLGKSKKQSGPPGCPQCLQTIIVTVPAPPGTRTLRKRAKHKRYRERMRKLKATWKAQLAAKLSPPPKKTTPPVASEDVPELSDNPSIPDMPPVPIATKGAAKSQAELTGEVKGHGRKLTDEEIKANLKKKLEAFNVRMKQKGKTA